MFGLVELHTLWQMKSSSAERVLRCGLALRAGDQEDVSVLNEIVEDAAQFSGYDIIVDDGGHKASQMLTSFRVSHSSPPAASHGALGRYS